MTSATEAHDILYLNITNDTRTNYYLAKVHVTGLPAPYYHKETGRAGVHFRLTAECVHNQSKKDTVFILFDYWLLPEDIKKAGGDKAHLPIQTEIKPIKYAHSKNSLKDLKFTFSMKDKNAVSLQEMFDFLFKNKKRHRFKVDENGLGCLHWIQVMLDDMESAKWFDKNAPNEIERLGIYAKIMDVEPNCYIWYGKGTFF